MKKVFSLAVLLFWVTLSYTQGKNNNSLLWRIDSNNSDTPSYLFGTIHLPQKKFIVYSDSVYAAIQNTRIFYNEVDFLNQSLFGDTGMLTFLTGKNRHLDSIKKTESWKRLIDKINRKYNAHLSYDSSEQFIEFSQKIMNSYYEPEEGVSLPDIMLASHAVMLGKKTGGLETYRLQFNMIYEILDARLRDTTMQLEDEAELTTGLKKFYIDGKTDSITRMVEQINPTYREIVFDRRNKTMADSIAKHLGEMPSFFAVGAGHLGGKQGVIELLRKKGFTLTPVHSDNKISLLVINNMLKMSGKFGDKKEDEMMTEVRIDTSGIKDQLMEAVQEPPPPPPPMAPKGVKMKKPAATKPKTKKKP